MKEKNANRYIFLYPIPTDAFSKIPYEKGSLFLLYLERTVDNSKGTAAGKGKQVMMVGYQFIICIIYTYILSYIIILYKSICNR